MHYLARSLAQILVLFVMIAAVLTGSTFLAILAFRPDPVIAGRFFYGALGISAVAALRAQRYIERRFPYW